MAVEAKRSVSVVIPVYDEEDNVEALLDRLLATLRPLGRPFEVIFVDDGSRDRTPDRLRARLPGAPELVLVRLRRNFGQTLALQAGFDRARGDYIVTLDGDGQNDPADIPRLIEELEKGVDVVSGWRRRRQDAFLVRNVPSRAANHLIRLLTRVPIHDQGCALKAYRRDVLERLGLYSDLHRFIVVLTMSVGASIREIEVQHHPRAAGRSKYGLSRVLKVMADLLAVQMLTRFQESPTRWFALLGLPFLLGSLASGLLAAWMWGSSVVLPTVSILCTLVFASCLLAGLLGESVVATAGGSPRSRVVYREQELER